MNPASAARILERLKPSDRVLDVGGWMKPFPRADYVMDIMPYEGRGLLGTVHEGPERFSKETWIVRDFCDRQPYPFPDKYFDFVICSHVLEDIRDPVFVCSELQRIARAGYIETPSRLVEQTMGVESETYPGYCHHRWLVESDGKSMTFTMKNARIASHWRLHLPSRARKTFTPMNQITSLFWEDSFEATEQILITVQDIEADLERTVRGSGIYPESRYKLWDQGRALKNGAKKLIRS